jgi:hypothetical protein
MNAVEIEEAVSELAARRFDGILALGPLYHLNERSEQATILHYSNRWWLWSSYQQVSAVPACYGSFSSCGKGVSGY